MKKILLSTILSSFTVYASGPYDGIWKTSPDFAYVTVNQNSSGNVIAVFEYFDNTGTGRWEAALAQGIQNNTATFSVLLGNGGSGTTSIVFDSPNSATATQISCSPAPNSTCLPNGSTYKLIKVW